MTSARPCNAPAVLDRRAAIRDAVTAEFRAMHRYERTDAPTDRRAWVLARRKLRRLLVAEVTT